MIGLHFRHISCGYRKFGSSSTKHVHDRSNLMMLGAGHIGNSIFFLDSAELVQMVPLFFVFLEGTDVVSKNSALAPTVLVHMVWTLWLRYCTNVQADLISCNIRCIVSSQRTEVLH